MDAYRKVNALPKDEYVVPPSWLMPFLEEYLTESAQDDFHDTSSQFITYPKPVNAAKKLALNAAITLTPREGTVVTYGDNPNDSKARHRTLVLADEIYQWLTEPETDKR